MPDFKSVSESLHTAIDYLMDPFSSNDSSWKRIAAVALPLILCGVGVAYLAKKYFYTTQSTNPQKQIPLEKLQADLLEKVPRFQAIAYENVKERHEAAKAAFSKALVDFKTKSEVWYVKAEDSAKKGKVDLSTALSPGIFSWRATRSVANDILAACSIPYEIHLFGVASQYNVTEATSRFTPLPGLAMDCSKKDDTQGPAAQRTNPILFELINAYLSNMGYNMLAYVLGEAAYQALHHGYLTPQDKAMEAAVAQDFEKNWSQVEQPCFSSYPVGSDHPVYLMLSAAPAYGRYCNPASKSAKADDIQRYAALANFTAQFNAALRLAKDHPDKTVVYHPAGIGLGAFDNNPFIVGMAFKEAAMRFEQKIQKEGINNVKVQFDVLERLTREKKYELDGNALKCVLTAGLKKNKTKKTVVI